MGFNLPSKIITIDKVSASYQSSIIIHHGRQPEMDNECKQRSRDTLNMQKCKHECIMNAETNRCAFTFSFVFSCGSPVPKNLPFCGGRQVSRRLEEEGQGCLRRCRGDLNCCCSGGYGDDGGCKGYSDF